MNALSSDKSAMCKAHSVGPKGQAMGQIEVKNELWKSGMGISPQGKP
jgi:hypothetical protein